MLRVLLLASAPALFWLWVFYRRDRWEKEPLARVLQLFGLGALVAAPVYFLEGWLPGPRAGWYDAFVRVALTEELFKLAPVGLLVYRRRDFNEPMDGILYLVASALGFATVENVLYALHGGGILLLYRAFTSTLAHVGFSGLVGYALGTAKVRDGGGTLLVARALLGAVALHGAYDLLLAYGSGPHAPDLVGRIALVVILPVLLVLLFVATNRACKASPFRRDGDGRASTPAPEPRG